MKTPTEKIRQHFAQFVPNVKATSPAQYQLFRALLKTQYPDRLPEVDSLWEGLTSGILF